MEQQAKSLPLDELCILLKFQVPIKQLNLSSENLNKWNNCLKLKRKVMNNDQTGRKTGAIGARALSEALKTNTTLQSLNLWSEQEESDEGG